MIEKHLDRSLSFQVETNQGRYILTAVSVKGRWRCYAVHTTSGSLLSAEVKIQEEAETDDFVKRVMGSLPVPGIRDFTVLGYRPSLNKK